MPRMRSSVALAVLAVAFGTPTGFAHGGAENDDELRTRTAPPQTKRTVVIRSDLDGMPGKQMLAWVAEIAPGASIAWHQHPYDEFVYILEGSVTVQIEGETPVTVHAGETFHTPANTVHMATNASDASPAKGLVFGLTSEGDPLAVPVEK